ncbi:MAG TPA: glycosyltransferase family 39 protein [Anaerolineales bacterium]|nr:glycosyltransferase family 39 protein [Anaerolineales bacterium]
MKKYIAVLFLLWTGVIITAYYVIQKPGLLTALTGLLDTVWTLLVAVILLFNANGLGRRILGLLKFEAIDSIDHLVLSWGIGLGVLGVLGLFFSAAQLANEMILTIFQIALALFFLFRNDLKILRADFNSCLHQVHAAFSQYSFFTRVAVGLTALLSFLLTLAPPFEAFDALLYHLTLPANTLQNGGLYAANNVPFWFPGLTEHVYLWALGMGSERAAQILHFGWAILFEFLLWHWSVKGWDNEIGRKTLLLLAAIPSLVMLASWAYADMALVYYAVAALYAFAWYRFTRSSSWLFLAGIMAGFAMSIKYTSFVVPLTCGLLLFFHSPLRKAISSAAQFSLIALAVAAPWYIRNAIMMGNPIYPFVFGGRYWDDFLATWYAEAETGIGWNALQILLLPLNTVLGVQDVTFFDGRIGVLFLILAPFTVWILISRSRPDSAAGWSLIAVGVFSLLSFAAWTVGVINSSALWQARLLLPALIPFAIPTALGWASLKAFDTPRLRISSLVNGLISLVVVLTLIDNTLFVLQRNPLAVATGAQSRERYIERINPSYAALMTLMEDLPAEARLYSLFEPRSYGLPRTTQPDPIVYNFAYDVYRYKTPADILQHWKSEQYTHILVYERGLDFMKESETDKFTPALQKTLEDTLSQLILIDQTPDQVYSIYQIP